tara:strand:+ start:4763 stop:5176 length:414 start_codon:yes stop_codon:yes gene_type:complete
MSNLREELTAMRYNDLKVKFQELGIGEVFRAGIKKVVLIDTAVELIEKKDSITEEVTVEELEIEIVKDREEIKEVLLSEFEKAVNVVTSTDGIWTKETMEKRIWVLENVFLQHRSSIKGLEARAKQEVLEAALKIMF